MCPPAIQPAAAGILQHTPLHSLHLSRHAKMVPFAGYEMPLQYAHGIKHEHEHTRVAAGLFDVSHMGQIRITGAGCDAALERLVTGDITGLPQYQTRYTLFTNEQGGVIDDLMVTRTAEGLFLVVNAACKDTDLAHLQESLGPDCHIETMTDRALLALQGPRAAAVLESLGMDAATLSFMQAGEFRIHDVPCFITRSGYTGEDGFELSVSADRAVSLAEMLLEHSDVEAVGLGARDSLRLEAGLCLYGHDLDETTTPVEADLVWTIAKKYRNGEAEAFFPGAGVILEQLEQGAERKRVGLKAEGRVPVREGATIADNRDETVGIVTSGGFGVTVGGPVAMGYVEHRSVDTGTILQVEVRGRHYDVRVVELPFIQTRYHKK